MCQRGRGDASEVAELIQVTCWIGKAAGQGRHTGLAWGPGPSGLHCPPDPAPGGKGGRVGGQDLECVTELTACKAV